MSSTENAMRISRTEYVWWWPSPWPWELHVGIIAGKGASLRAEIIAFSWLLFKQRTTAYVLRRRWRDYCNTPPANWPTSQRIVISSRKRIPDIELPLSPLRLHTKIEQLENNAINFLYSLHDLVDKKLSLHGKNNFA